jgi:hypothetical protein
MGIYLMMHRPTVSEGYWLHLSAPTNAATGMSAILHWHTVRQLDVFDTIHVTKELSSRWRMLI